MNNEDVGYTGQKPPRLVGIIALSATFVADTQRPHCPLSNVQLHKWLLIVLFVNQCNNSLWEWDVEASTLDGALQTFLDTKECLPVIFGCSPETQRQVH